MSLIGSLDDLGLGDILQIINLSQKSGVLIVISDRGEGRVLFRDGLVRGAAQKGGPQTLQDVLVAGGLSADAVEAAGGGEALDVSKVLVERGLLTEDRLVALCREAVESAVVRMFSWHSGEFSFDVRSEGEPGDPELLLAAGISAQYLAMEGVRLQDEGAFADESQFDFGGSESGAELEWASAESVESVEPAEPAESVDPQAEAIDILADRAVAAAAPGCEPSDELVAVAEEENDPSESQVHLAQLDNAPLIDAEAVTSAPREPAHELSAPEAEVLAPVAADIPKPSLIVIDPEPRVLEWSKRVLKSEFERVHIFQQSNLGLVRIRQYLTRGQMPLVLISPKTTGEPAAGILDAADFVKRLKSQAPRMPVFWLCEDTVPESDGPADGSVARPRIGLLRDARAAHERDGLAEVLRRELQAGLARVRGDASGQPPEKVAKFRL